MISESLSSFGGFADVDEEEKTGRWEMASIYERWRVLC